MVGAEPLVTGEGDDVTGQHMQVGLSNPGNLEMKKKFKIKKLLVFKSVLAVKKQMILRFSPILPG